LRKGNCYTIGNGAESQLLRTISDTPILQGKLLSHDLTVIIAQVVKMISLLLGRRIF
jgi:hypothetical protein